MSVRESMGLREDCRACPRGRSTSALKEAAKILDLEPTWTRKPKALSGGQRQRVAMGRDRSQVFLMDEPLSNGRKLRVQTRTQNPYSLQRGLGMPPCTSHDRAGLTMSDRIAVSPAVSLQRSAPRREKCTASRQRVRCRFISSPP